MISVHYKCSTLLNLSIEQFDCQTFQMMILSIIIFDQAYKIVAKW